MNKISCIDFVLIKDIHLECLYDFVLIQEFFQDDFTDLSRLLCWSEIKLWQENENQHSDYKNALKNLVADRKLISKILSLNKKDVAIYKQAIELRAKRQGISVKKLTNELEFYHLLQEV